MTVRKERRKRKSIPFKFDIPPTEQCVQGRYSFSGQEITAERS
jgi:hypothetical protein